MSALEEALGEEVARELKELRLQNALLRLQRNHWKREALAYFERLRPHITIPGAQKPGDPKDQVKDEQLAEDREAIAQAIAKRAPPGDPEYQRRLEDYGEKELRARGLGSGDAIAADILSGDTGDVEDIDEE